MVNNLVSIIIPTYKTNHSLKRAIDSALKQTYNNIEVIVIDDNGVDTDGRKEAEAIMKEYANTSRVIYIQHPTSKNGSAARNTGVKNSRGKFIAFLDDDDFFYEDKIEKQVALLEEKTDCGICVCFYKQDGIKKHFKIKENYTKDIIMLNSVPQTSSFLIRKEIFDAVNGFDSSYYRHQDFEFLIRVGQITKIAVVKEYLYGRNNNGVDNRPSGKSIEDIKDKFLQQFSPIFNDYNISKNKAYARNYAYVLLRYIRNKDHSGIKSIITKHFSIRLLLYTSINAVKISFKKAFKL